MPIADAFPGPYGDIIRPVRGCELCGSRDLERDPDGLWCCADCGLTTLRDTPAESGG